MTLWCTTFTPTSQTVSGICKQLHTTGFGLFLEAVGNEFESKTNHIQSDANASEQSLAAILFLHISTIFSGLKGELPDYLHQVYTSPDIDAVEWWKLNASTLTG